MSTTTVLLGLQRAAGNRAVGRWLSGAQPPRRGIARSEPGDRPKGSFAGGRERVPDVTDPQRVGAALGALEQDSDELAEAAARLTAADARTLAIDQRVALIAVLARSGWIVGDPVERAIIRLIRTVPRADCTTLIERLRADRAALLHTLEAAMDGQEYLEYHRALKELFERSVGDAGRMAELVENARMLPWGDPPHARAAVGAFTGDPVPRFHYDELGLRADGLMHMSYHNGLLLIEPAPADPFELMLVLLVYDEPEIGVQAWQVVPMPAINLMVLSWKQFRQDLATAVNTGLLVGGGVSGLYASTRLAAALAGLDTALGLAGTVIEDYRADIAKRPGGQEFLKAWDVTQWLITLYSLKNVVMGATGMFRTLRERWRAWRGLELPTEDAKRLEQLMEELIEEVEEVEAVVNPPPPVFRKPSGPNANEAVRAPTVQMPPTPAPSPKPGKLEGEMRALVDPQHQLGFDVWMQEMRAKGTPIETVLGRFDAAKVQSTSKNYTTAYHRDVTAAQEAERLRLRAQDDPFEPILKNNERIDALVTIHYENVAPSADEVRHAQAIARRTGEEVRLFGDTAHGVLYPGIDGTIGNPRRPLQLKTMGMDANAEVPRGMAQIAHAKGRKAGYSGIELEILMPGKTLEEVKAAWNVKPTVDNPHELLDYYEGDIIEKITILCSDGGVWVVPKGLPLTGPLPPGI